MNLDQNSTNDASAKISGQGISLASAQTRRLLVDGLEVDVPHDLYECLCFESRERGITLAQAYQEELAARRLLATNNISNGELDAVAIKAPKEWLQEDA